MAAPGDHDRYVIIGGGLAGASAVAGIRELDPNGSIRLFADEPHLPYHRPHLSKKLWFGKKTVSEIFVNAAGYYDGHGVRLAPGTPVAAVDARAKSVTDANGKTCSYDKLLIATGGTPRRLPIPGGEEAGLCYFRRLDDYLRLREQAQEGRRAVVIGGGFIGSEMAAALAVNKLHVTLLFPSPYICNRVFPESLGRALQEQFRARGVEILAGDKPTAIAKRGEQFTIETAGGKRLEADIVVAGLGIAPETALARSAGLRVGDGIGVNEYLQSSDPDIYAAGDNACFPCAALGKPMRVEHWDNALNQGKQAGRNMAGAHEPYSYLPYFFSDLFEFGYEAVGDVRSDLETFADWRKENDTGVIYYLEGARVRGAMMCNVWDKVPAARELIEKGEARRPQSLRGAIG